MLDGLLSHPPGAKFGQWKEMRMRKLFWSIAATVLVALASVPALAADVSLHWSAPLEEDRGGVVRALLPAGAVTYEVWAARDGATAALRTTTSQTDIVLKDVAAGKACYKVRAIIVLSVPDPNSSWVPSDFTALGCVTVGATLPPPEIVIRKPMPPTDLIVELVKSVLP